MNSLKRLLRFFRKEHYRNEVWEHNARHLEYVYYVTELLHKLEAVTPTHGQILNHTAIWQYVRRIKRHELDYES